MLDRRLISAEVLKLRRRRGMLAIATLLTAGLVLLVYAVTGIQHAGNPAKYAAAGGDVSFTDSLTILTIMAAVVGTIVGATAGTQDLETGVFRDLAATGRSRTALFGARVMGAWAVVLPLLGITMVIDGVLSVALAGSLGAPSAGTLVAGTAGVLAAGGLATAMAVGISALVGSRGPVIGILLAWSLAIQPLLAGLTLLGVFRQGVPSLALGSIADVQVQGGDLHVALGVAIAVVFAWGAAALGLGAWKTRTREI